MEEDNIICPQTGKQCYRTPHCKLAESTGKTMCAEWLLAQRQIGRKELEDNTRSTTKTRT